MAEFIGSSIAGFIAPIYQVYIKKIFSDEELPIVSMWEVYLFAANFVIGEALGAVIYSLVTPQTFFLVDFFTYVIAAVLIYIGFRFDLGGLSASEGGEKSRKFRWTNLSATQKRAFLLMPILSLTCGPSMSLLASRGAMFGNEIEVFGLAMTPAVVILFVKSLGQVSAPLLVKRISFEKMLNADIALTICLAIYLLLYCVILQWSFFLGVLVCVVLAHIASNIVYCIASYGFTKYFSIEEIASASAAQYQVSLAALVGGVSIAGVIAENGEMVFVPYFSFIFVGVAFWLAFRVRSRNTNFQE